MASMTKRLLFPLLLAASVARAAFGQVPGPAKDPLAAARELYASARYDEALAVLNDMHPADPGVSDRRSIEQYRSLCLLALGRGSEAENAIAAVVTADPAYLPNETDASPRVRAAFSDVRKKLLPEIASSRYAAAKATFDLKDYLSASQQFRQVLALLDDPDTGGRLADLRQLAAGFLDLSVAAATPPPAPRPETAAPAPAPQVETQRVYSADDPGVSSPVIIKQDMPRLPQSVMIQSRQRGILEVIIDEQGRVASMAVRQSLHPVYDGMLLNAARDWRYQPATVNGKPVRYRKLIQVNVTK